MAKNILLINGPNLNMLGTREPSVYGSTTLADVESALNDRAVELGAALATYQSNHEGALIDRIQLAKQQGTEAIIINPGGLTHTSVALLDALRGVDIPFIEVHISNIHQREPFRHHSFLSGAAIGVICGLGVDGYRAALEFAINKIG